MEDAPRDRGASEIEPDRGPLERAYDEYLEAALRGEAEDLDAFCARHGDASGELRRWLEGLLAALPGAPDASRAPRPALGVEPGLPFERLGEFRLLRRLGAGGMGIVYLAEQESLGRLVALKVVRPEYLGTAEAEVRFRREAQAAAKLRHPNIVAVHASGEENGVRYLAMELVPGEGLDEILREARERDERIPIPKALRWIASIARALQCAHEANLVHRDVKPSNIRITPEGRPLLVDFGLARETSSATLTRTGEFRGTAAYASPEQVAARRTAIDARTDVYSLGATLYECVTGRVPFEGETTEQVFHQILGKEPVPPRRLNPAIPRDLETVVLAAMEKDRDRRYPSTAAFAGDLESLLEVRPIRAKPAGPFTRSVKFARRNPAFAGVAGLGALALLGFLGLAAKRRLDFGSHLTAARAALEAGELPRARDALERARAIDRGSVAARDLLERLEQAERRARAEEALGEASDLLAEYRGTGSSLEPLLARLEAARKRFETVHMPPAEVEALFRDEDAFVRARRNLDGIQFRLQEALARAERHDPEHPRLRPVRAEWFLEKWREAVAGEDDGSEAFYRSKVAEYDRDGRFRAELEGTGTISLDGTPEGAAVHLFRYELQSKVKPGGERRLVPVPFDPEKGLLEREGAQGPERAGELHPGEVVLHVDRVEPGSPASEAGIRRGDFLSRIEGFPIEGTVFAVSLDPAGAAAKAGVRPFSRIASLAGREIREAHDLDFAWLSVEAGETYETVFVGPEGERRVEAGKGDRGSTVDLDLIAWSAIGFFESVFPPHRARVRVLSEGRARDVEFEEGESSGLRVSGTAYPLECSEANRMGLLPLPPFEAPPGSYLFVLRKPGYEDLRLPVLLPRLGSVEARADLLLEGTSPPRFVWIPPGPFVSGGDPDAPRSLPREEREVEGFWIARFEVTEGEYLEFLNDPATLAEIEAAEREGRFIRVPRAPQAPSGLWKKEGGKYGIYWDGRRPVLGVDWHDATAYCEWRSAKAKESGEPWVYELPTEEEWEKAARGVDGRKFPWGDTFDWRFCKGSLTRAERREPEPVGRFVKGESPWGVLDMEGSAQEWCARTEEHGSLAPMRGAAFSHGAVQFFRTAYRTGIGTRSVAVHYGFRIVARRAPERR